MKPIRVNTTWEEDEENRRKFFAGLSYNQLLKCFIKSNKLVNFHKVPVKRYDLQLSNSAMMFKVPYLNMQHSSK